MGENVSTNYNFIKKISTTFSFSCKINELIFFTIIEMQNKKRRPMPIILKIDTKSENKLIYEILFPIALFSDKSVPRNMLSGNM